MWIQQNLTTGKNNPLKFLIIPSLTLLGFALRLYHLGTPSLWFDELLQLDIAQGAFWQIWPKLHAHAAMPLDYFILHGWIKLGRQEMWVRFPAVIFGTLAIPTIYTLAKHLFNERVGFLAASLLSLASFSVRYSQEVRPYALLMLLVILAYLGLWQSYQTGDYRYWGVSIFGILGAILSHYFALFMLLPIGLFVGGHQLRHWRNKTYWYHSAYFALCLTLLLSGVIICGRGRVLYNVGSRYLREVSQPQTLTRPAEEKPNKGTGPALDTPSLSKNFLVPLATSDAIPLLIYNGFFIVAIISLILQQNQKKAAYLLMLAWLILPSILIYLFLLQRGTFFAVRYILYTLPAYLILVALGIDKLIVWVLNLMRSYANLEVASNSSNALNTHNNPINPLHSLQFPLYLLCLLPLIFAEFNELLIYYHTPAYEDWRSVGQLLEANALPDDSIIALRAEPTMNWYYPPAQAAHYTLSRNEAILAEIETHPRRWFILSSYSRRLDQGLRDWLQEKEAIAIGIDKRVIVYFHQEEASKREMLAEVETFWLPENRLTYSTLAEQFKQVGDEEMAKYFYKKAKNIALSDGKATNTPP